MKIEKSKAQKSLLKKKKKKKNQLKFEDYKHRLEATRLENKINHLEKNNFNVDKL